MKKWKKQLHFVAAYVLVLLLTGYAVYADPDPTADEPSVSEETTSELNATTDDSAVTRVTETDSEEGTSESTSEDISSETSETGSDDDIGDPTEESTELLTETTITIIASLYSEEDIMKMRDAYEERQNEVVNAEEELSSLKSRQQGFLIKLQAMDEMIIELQDKIDKLYADRREAEYKAEELEFQLEEAKALEEVQYEKLKDHIRNAYENGNYSYVDALLNAGSFVELLNKPEYVQEVSKYDEKLLNDYKSLSKALANQMLMIQVLTDGAGTLQTVYEDQQKALVLMQEAKEEEVLKYQDSIADQSYELERLKRLEEEQAERLKEMENPQITTITYGIVPYTGDRFVWPQPSSYYITSDYGWRGDIGIPGASKDHKGIDIKANMYDPVVAAAPGKVVYVGYYGTGGKTVMIDIGSTITIIYHHLNDYAVELGDTVEAGQVIGRVGMTGVTGGPHLHFSVRVNGTYVNPRPYLGLPMPIKQTITTETSTETNSGEDQNETGNTQGENGQ